ncbi:hypothetical protein, partial [Acetobacter tropicalis]|uniref:hypothetical protein n=1 Tax=Acetobacter tropicalis TaxID=104102 RepID=UPI000587E684
STSTSTSSHRFSLIFCFHTPSYPFFLVCFPQAHRVGEAQAAEKTVQVCMVGMGSAHGQGFGVLPPCG